MAGTLDTSWFLDSEPKKEASEATSALAELRRRPWQAHWPPKSKSDLHAWLSSEFPQVLSWHFDPDRPFDRPWRKWTRSARAKKDESPVLEIRQDMILPVGDINSTCSSTVAPSNTNSRSLGQSPALRINQSTSQDFSSTPNINLDEQLSRLQLVRVAPKTFNYLAPIDLYIYQKPYLSRLPCLDNLKRTNIVGQSYSVTVHNICGNEDLFTLEESGFQFLKLPAQMVSWTDHSVRSMYLPMLSVWLKEFFSCDRVLVYAYNVSSRVADSMGC